MHAYNANDAVRHFTRGSHIFPCTYIFPTTTFASAIAFAQTFTDLYIGLLTNIQQRTARSLDPSSSHPIIYVLAQALGQEGQQSGWFRALQGKPPSAEPFLTSSTRDFAFSWLQRWVVPGSCPSLEDIPLKRFPPLDVVVVVGGGGGPTTTGPVTLRVPGEVDANAQSVAFVNGALVPTVVPFEVTGRAAAAADYGMGMGTGTTVVTTEIVAEFPFARNVMRGMTLAAVVWNGPVLVTAEDVADATVYGPAVMEVD